MDPCNGLHSTQWGIKRLGGIPGQNDGQPVIQSKMRMKLTLIIPYTINKEHTFLTESVFPSGRVKKVSERICRVLLLRRLAL